MKNCDFYQSGGNNGRLSFGTRMGQESCHTSIIPQHPPVLSNWGEKIRETALRGGTNSLTRLEIRQILAFTSWTPPQAELQLSYQSRGAEWCHGIWVQRDERDKAEPAGTRQSSQHTITASLGTRAATDPATQPKLGRSTGIASLQKRKKRKTTWSVSNKRICGLEGGREAAYLLEVSFLRSTHVYKFSSAFDVLRLITDQITGHFISLLLRLWSAWLILFSWIWSFVWACADIHFWEGRSIWHRRAAKEKRSCRQGEYWKAFSTLQEEHFVFCVAFTSLSLCVRKDGFWFSSMKHLNTSLCYMYVSE